jgi:hypothetical protein
MPPDPAIKWSDTPPPPPAPAAAAPSGQWRDLAPEERYRAWLEHQEARIPRRVDPYVPTSLLPQTPAEAAVTGAQTVGDIAAGIGAIGAPETGGLSLIPGMAVKYGLPLAIAGGVGAYEAPPGQRWQRSKEEMEKTALGLAMAKPLEWAARMPARLFNERGMLEKSAGRIMGGVKDLFNKYPKELETPETMAGIRRDVSSGKLKDAVGRRLGEFRDMLRKAIPDYTPGRAAEVAHGLEGAETTAAVKPRGEAFRVFSPDNAGEMVPKDVGIGEAIDHVQKMNGMGYSGGGSETGGPLSWAYRKAGHQSRDSINERLNQIGAKYGIPNAGDLYARHSGDAGAAEILTDAFTNAQRNMAEHGVSFPVIDQPKLATRIEKELPHLRVLQPKSADAFSAAVAPTGGRAVIGGGRFGIRPFLPESRRMYGWPTRGLTKVPRILAPELGRVVPQSQLGALALQKILEHGGLPGLPEPGVEDVIP